jgi:hypothetical protein
MIPAAKAANRTTCSAAFGVEQAATCFSKDLLASAITTDNCANLTADLYLVKREPLHKLALVAQDLQRFCQAFSLEVC